MADAAVAITAGSGTNIDTRTEATNGNHRQVVVLGDPATNAGVAPVDATAGLKVDLGADNDITGTVTANLGATDNAVLDAIEADTTTIAGAVSGTEMQVDVVTSALPTGASTAAKQPALGTAGSASTDVITVQGIASMTALVVDGSGVTQPVSGTVTAELSATDNAVLDTIDAVLDTINAKLVTGTDIGDVTINNASGASAVNIQDGGNTITVDGTVTANLAAGTNNIGDVDILTIAAGDNNIGNVDIASIAAGDNNIGNVDLASSIPAGTNNIGDVDVLSLPATPAGTNAIGKLLPPDVDVTTHTNYAKKYYTSAGAVTDGIIWSPAAGKRWHVVSLFVQVSAAATVTLEDDLAAGDSPVLKMELAANSGIVIPFPEKYPLASGEDAADLLITTSAGNVYVTAVGYEV